MFEMKSLIRAIGATSMLVLLGSLVTGGAVAEDEPIAKALLIDDFSSDVSALGTRWEGFTDRVMGGKSTIWPAFRFRRNGPRFFLPWSAFVKGDFGSLFGFDPRKLASLAVVAYKKEFTADIYVAEVKFY